MFELPLEARSRPTRDGAEPEPPLGRGRGERPHAVPTAQAGVSERAGGCGARARPRVLVVDDEPQIVRALKVVLREAGFEALAAEDGPQALDLAAVRPPAAAIVDLVLPDGDGVEVTRRLREWSEMPILVLSAVGEEEQKVRALEAGADDYITKPFGTRELVARLQAALRRSDARRGGAGDRGRGPGDRSRRARGTARGRADPPDPDRVRTAARARAKPRAADDAPGAARGGVGTGVRRRHPAAAYAHRAVRAKIEPEGRRDRAISSPTRVSGTGSRCSRHKIVM